MIDDVAERLEALGMMKEAEELDAVANAIEAAAPAMTRTAPPAYTPQMMVEKTPPAAPGKPPEEGVHPVAFEIVNESRDAFDTHMGSIESALMGVNKLIDTMFNEALKRKPAVSDKVKTEAPKVKQRLAGLLKRIVEEIKNELRYFYHTVGGKEELERYSVDWLKLAAKK